MSNTNYNLEECIQQLIPFTCIDAVDRIKLAETGEVIEKMTGEILYSSEYENKILYLLNGKMNKCLKYFPSTQLKHNTSDALKPIFSEYDKNDSYVKPRIQCDILCLDRDLVKGMLNQKIVSRDSKKRQQRNYIENNAYCEIVFALENGELELPAFPKISFQIKKIVDSINGEKYKIINQVSKIIEANSFVSKKLIKLACDMIVFDDEKKLCIKNIVSYFGIKKILNIVLGFEIEKLFNAKNLFLNEQMKHFSDHSKNVTTVGCALISNIKDIAIDELILASMIHDIGVVPIISHLEKKAIDISNENEIRHLIYSLNAMVGALVVNSWKLSDEMSNVVIHAEDWTYDNEKKLNVEDIVIAAHVYKKISRDQLTDLPALNEIPALNKLLYSYHESNDLVSVMDNVKNMFLEAKVPINV